ncbi:unnamed protein product [Thelazia callipaeda]|uniref:ANK_REP_REGION domain-containing protein n=1 Tax=Thelazia callipaeda TaxID=103827 RepID=A0A0N5CYZ4_THECL|nr:unnamed protein product [Thelazia callipaeda]
MSDDKDCSISTLDNNKKPKPCCACPETKKARDECVILFGEEHCGELIEAHKRCMRQLMQNLNLVQLQVCQEDILKADIAIKNQIEDLRRIIIFRRRKFISQKEVNQCIRQIKDEMGKLSRLIDALEKFANKMNSRNDRSELSDQVKEHRNELERNRQVLRQAILKTIKVMAFISAASCLFNFQTTEGLTSLVAKMSDQLKLSEDTTSALIHSSYLLKDTESEYSSMGAHIQSGGKLISKYSRRECTDKVLITFALLLYVVVILYILRKRIRKLNFYYMFISPVIGSMDEKPVKTFDAVRTEFIDLLRHNNAEGAKRLLQKYDSLRTVKDDCGRTAIHWAASGGCLEIVQFCVSQREDDAVTSDDTGWTPLMIACSAGRLEVVRYLISLSSVNVNTQNNNKQTPLHYAASKNRPQITSILLKHGANINAQDNYFATPLHRATSQGHEKIVPILLAEPQLRINIADSAGCTPL